MPSRESACCVFLLSLLLSFASLYAQQEVLSGSVRDKNTYREISGVNVLVKGTQMGTSTDPSGRFLLRVPAVVPGMVVVFRHIGYERLAIPADSLQSLREIYLQPRVIPLQSVEIQEESERMEIERDLPQTVSTIDARNFEIRGYTDAGDLLRVDHSIQIDESISGKKTVAIRGGNADDVVVMYNGVKMNNAYDNVFDLSLIDLEDIERFEIIKGSNTALYGPEAFSGVINIVPKVEQNYNIRFQQRLGTYRSGNWGLHLYKKFDRVQAAYSYKRGALRRTFVDDQSLLRNDARHQTGTVKVQLSRPHAGHHGSAVTAMWFDTSLNFKNERDNERLDNDNKLFSAKYSGDVFAVRNIDLSVSYRKLDESQLFSLNRQFLDRRIEDRSLHVGLQKQMRFRGVDWLLGYQFQDAELNFLNDQDLRRVRGVGLKSADFSRRHHGFVSIVKYHGETGSDFFQSFNIETSLRHDRVSDDQSNTILYGDTPVDRNGNPIGLFGNKDWQDTVFKLGVSLDGYRKDLAFNAFLTLGNNVKFPTLFQQVSSPQIFTGLATKPNLDREKSNSFELGASVSRDIRNASSIYGFRVSGTFFQTYYDNKFREFTTPGLSIVFYDNAQDVRISGVESKSSIFLLRKKVTFEVGLSRYFISDKTAFPFKSNHKQTVSLLVDHAGYSFQIFWFREGEQTALLRQPNNVFAQVTLPQYINLDVHLSKSFEIGRFKLFANASGRNLLKDDDTQLVGLAIRDRRFYLTIGAQY